MTRPILDACCGSRMFWFDRHHPSVIYMDNRNESHTVKDSSSSGGQREIIIDPDYQGDFTDMPWEDEQFALVVFDPPHLVRNGSTGWLAKKYGKLQRSWENDLTDGFLECFRVLKHHGVLIFKWNEHEIPVSKILALTDQKPLFGNRCGKTAKTHWIVFMKGAL